MAGATGFIGGEVARALAAAGARLCLPARDEAAAARRFGALGIEGEVPAWDALEPATVAEVVRGFRPHVTFDLVGYGIDPAERDPALADAVNHRFARTLCEEVARWRDENWPGCALVRAGSALEYGAAAGDLRESTPARPTTLYGRTKLAGTSAAGARAEALALPAVTARLFTVYGPGERPGRLLPSLLRAARDGRPLALTDGLQRRDFTYVEDVAEGLLRIAAAVGAPAGEIVNLATGALTTVREFAGRAARVLGLDPSLLRFGALPTRPEEMAHDPPSLERLERRVGWRPATSIEEGVRRTVERADEEGPPPAG